MSDWKRQGVEHLERHGCIINIREEIVTREGKKATHVEILPDPGWKLDGCINNRLEEVV